MLGHDTNVCAGCTNNGVMGDVQTLVSGGLAPKVLSFYPVRHRVVSQPQ